MLHISEELARRLLSEQLPCWANWPLRRQASAGTDHALFRLGDKLALRMPLRKEAARQVEKEQRWLPVLAPQLPLPIPVPIACGKASAIYPFAWSVLSWLPGESADRRELKKPGKAAQKLGRFVRALREIDADDAPTPGQHNFHRGLPLQTRDAELRKAMAGLPLSLKIDLDKARTMWESALDAPLWNNPPVWIHGDLHPANLLINDEGLQAVIDFGGLAAGDPACDAMAGWTLFDAETRELFRQAGGFTDDAWLRGRGWALSMGLIALPHYPPSHPFYRLALRMTHEVLADS